MLGNLDKWPAIHVFGTVQGRYTAGRRHPHPRVRPARRRRGRRRRTPRRRRPWSTGSTRATSARTSTARATTRPGRPSPRARASSSSPAPGCRPTCRRRWATTSAFMLPPAPRPAAAPSRTGGTGLPFAITSKSKHPDAAAAYIDFITNADAMPVLAENGNLPVVETAAAAAPGALRQGRVQRVRHRRRPTTAWCPTSTTRRRPWTTPSARAAGPAGQEGHPAAGPRGPAEGLRRRSPGQ